MVKRDKIRTEYESLHIMELLIIYVQYLQVNDVIPILSPAVYCNFGRCGSHMVALCDRLDYRA